MLYSTQNDYIIPTIKFFDENNQNNILWKIISGLILVFLMIEEVIERI